MNRLKVISKKYNGSFRSTSEGLHLDAGADHICVLARPDETFFYHSHGKSYTNRNGMLQYYFTDRWYNVMHMCDSTGSDWAMYINLCAPAVLDGDTLTWVDLDLDYLVTLDGEVKLLDEEEFAQNSKRWRYPKAMVDTVRDVTDNLAGLIDDAAFPFNHIEQREAYRKWMASDRTVHS
ncbi:MAG: DUF402 domain-containing protein [Rhodothermales bacterium]|nr:DUF402 domain-containing protein [Rhodothermales bacterium]